jgi:hypothetical protein
VVRHVGHRRGVTGRASRFRGGSGRLSGRTVCGEGRGARLSHRDLTARPRACLLDRPTRTLIAWTRLLEEAQHVLRAGRSPHGKEPMIGVSEDAAATHGDKTGVAAALLVHDHRVQFGPLLETPVGLTLAPYAADSDHGLMRSS